MILEIGNKPLNELTAEDLRQIVLIENCVPSLEFWNEPEVTRFNNNTFSNTIVIDYFSLRKKDNLKSGVYTFFFNFEDFSFHYVRDNERNDPDYQSNGKRVRLETLRYLIQKGFDIPIIEKTGNKNEEVLMETKDTCYGMKLTKGNISGLIKIEPHEHGTDLSEKDVVKLISVLSEWLNERYLKRKI